MRGLPIATVQIFRKDKTGSTAVMLAVAFPALIGAFILTMEVGFWYHSKTTLQNTADMAAIAGARDYVASADVEQSKTAVIADARDNSFDPWLGDLTTNIPPVSGAYTGQTAVQVSITQEIPTFFIDFFRVDPMIASVVAVAALQEETAPACVVSLSATGTGISVGGNSGVELTGCMLHSNSTSSLAISAYGASTLSAECTSSVGGVSLTSNIEFESCSAPWENAPPIDDPFDYLDAPSLTGTHCDLDPIVTGNGNNRLTTITGDTNGDGIIRLCGDIDLYGDVTLAPGTYVIDGGELDFKSGATLTGDGVTLIFMNDAELGTVNNSNEIHLTAPTSGDFTGIAIFADPDSMGRDDWTFNGQSSVSIDGAIYAPTIDLDYAGGFGALSTSCTQLVANTVNFRGNSGFESDCSAYGLNPILVSGYSDQVVLVE